MRSYPTRPRHKNPTDNCEPRPLYLPELVVAVVLSVVDEVFEPESFGAVVSVVLVLGVSS